MNKKLPVKEKTKEIIKTKTLEEIENSIKNLSVGFDARFVLQEADKELQNVKGKSMASPESYIYKSITLFEFDKGMLLVSSISEMYRTFALEFNKNLQKEYSCATPSEKSLAEIVALNFIRVLQTQTKINNYLNKDSLSDLGVGYLNVMSKELDRAQRHYLTSLQTLKMLRAPTLAVNIKTQTAIVGQNQIVQSNNTNDKAI